MSAARRTGPAARAAGCVRVVPAARGSAVPVGIHTLARRLAALAVAVLVQFAGMGSAHAAGLGNFYLQNNFTTQCADLAGTGLAANDMPVWQDTCLWNASSDNQEWGFLPTRTTAVGQLYESSTSRAAGASTSPAPAVTPPERPCR